MSKQLHGSSASDLNLLFGILAVQMDFISREQLIGAMQAWLCDKTRALGAILVEQDVLSTPRLFLLNALVEEHLKQHRDDAHQSLAAVGPLLGDGGALKHELEKLADADVQATLVNVGGDSGDSAPDPYATSDCAVSEQSAAGLRFRILRPHASGGLGTVYVAHDEELHREVALKEMHDQHAHNQASRARFLLEAEITGRLEHPGIVPVYGLGHYADGRPYYAMRFIKGDSLQDAIERFHKAEQTERDPIERALEMRGLLGRLIDVCNAIQYAHDRGVLHRDLKPGNIMLGKYGETLVVDWGLAKPMGSREHPSEESSLRPKSHTDSSMTLQGSALGTPSFMSPEQAEGKIDQLGPASDVYSLGATLYCLLTGKAPVDGSMALEHGKFNLATLLKKVQTGDFPRPSQLRPEVDRALEAICVKAMSLKPADRYRTPRALADDLEHWLADRPVNAWPEPWSVRMRRWLGQHRTLVASAAAAALVGVVSLIVLNLVQKSLNDELGQSNTQLVQAEQDASQKKKDAIKAREEAVAALEKTRQAQEETAEALALNTITLAQTRWNEGQVEMADDLLDDVPSQYRSRSGGWSFLKKKYEGSYCTLYGHLSPVNAVAFSPYGRHIASVSSDRTVHLWNAWTGALEWTAAGHASGTTGVAFSPDGTLVASSSWDGTIKVWDVRQKKELLTFAKHSKDRNHIRDVANVAFSPDGRRIASVGDDHTIKVWDPRTGEEFFTLIGHDGPVRGVAFSPDGKSIASSSDDMTVKIWDADKAGPARMTLKGHTDKIWCVACSPDGRHLASASDDDTVKIWQVGSDKELFSLKGPEGHSNDVRSVAFSPNGRYLASASYDKTVKLWDVGSGKLHHTFIGHTGPVVGLSFSPDGQRLASAGADRTVKLWDARGDHELLAVHGHQKPVMSAMLSPDGKRLATAGKDNSVKVWDARTGQVLFACEGRDGHTAAVNSVAFSGDGERLASGGDDHFVKVWHGQTGKLLWSKANHNKEVRCVTFRPDGKQLASASDDGSIKLWDADTGTELTTLTGHAGGVWCVAFSPGGHRLASASADMTIKIWNIPGSNAAATHDIFTLSGHNAPVACLSFSPTDDRLVSGSFDQSLKIWDANKGQLLSTVLAHARAVLSVSFSPDGKRLASAGRQGGVKLWDAGAGLELWSMQGHGKAVNSVSFSNDGETLVSAGDDHTCKLWDIHTGKENVVLKGHKSGVRSVAFSKDGQRFASAGWDGTVKMWQAGTGELLPVKFLGHKDKVTYVQFDPNGELLATASEDKTVKLWNASTGADLRTLAGHTAGVQAVAFSHDGKKLASASSDSTAKIWASSTGKLLETLTGHTNEVRGVAFSFDDLRVASAGYDKTVRLWDAATGQSLLTFDKHTNWVTGANFSPSGKRVVSRDFSEMILVWDSETGQVLHNSKDPDPSPFPAKIVEDGKLVLTTPKRIQIIDLRPPVGGELAYRQVMARLKPWWHEELAEKFEREADWFAAGFHSSWAVVFAPAAAEKWERLDRACRQLKNWQLAQMACNHIVAQEPSREIHFPEQAPWLNFLRAIAYSRIGQKSQATACFDRAVLPKEPSQEQRAIFEQMRLAAERELASRAP